MRSPGFLVTLLLVLVVGCTNTGSEQANSESLKLPPTEETKPTKTANAKAAATLPPQSPLIPPTDPRTRVRQVPVGRVDPFAPTLGRLTVTRKIDEKAAAAALATAQPAKGSKVATATKAATPAAPPPPLTQKVYVAGVISSGSGVTAIVQTPERPDGESVQVGSRIRQGRLTVAAIDAQGPVGVVWFKEAGRARALPRFVGQPMAADAKKSDQKTSPQV